MIIDFREDPDIARLYSVVATDTGECLDRERIFRADDKAGVYWRYWTDDDGFVQHDPKTNEFRTERVERAIRLVPKLHCCWCNVDLLPGERFACNECRREAERIGTWVESLYRTNRLPPRIARGLGF